jgi:hypothetical protein
MAKFGISPEGAEELLKLSEQLKKIVSDNEQAGTNLFKEISWYSNKLGLYDIEIKKLAYASIETSLKCNDDILYLSKKISDLSAKIQALLGMDLSVNNVENSSNSCRQAFLNSLKVSVNSGSQSSSSGNSDDPNIGQRERDITKKYHDDEERLSISDSLKIGSVAKTLLGKGTFQGININCSTSKNAETPSLVPIKGEPVFEPNVDIKPLLQTNQEIRVVRQPNGITETIFDHPDKLSSTLPYFQGNNQRGKNGTCGLADTAMWLYMAGSKYYENDVVNYAFTHMNSDGSPLCGNSGGTIVENRAVIWDKFGIPSNYYYTKGHNVDNMLERVGQAVENGCAVSMGVNAGKLWNAYNPMFKDYSKFIGDGGSNHVIGIVSCVRDYYTGEITHFYINDTGRNDPRDACRRVSYNDLKNAFNVERSSTCISKNPVW